MACIGNHLAASRGCLQFVFHVAASGVNIWLVWIGYTPFLLVCDGGGFVTVNVTDRAGYCGGQWGW